METLKDEMDFLIEVICGVSPNGEIVHIHDKPSFMDVVSKVEIHEHLESQRGSTESKKHYCQFEKSQEGGEGSLPFISFFDADVVVSPLYIKFSEMIKLLKVINKVRDEREGICVFDSVLVKILIVLNWMKFAIFLFDETEQGGLRRFCVTWPA